MHTLYCIIGRTGSGKSTITKQAANKLNARILKSYTTRARRKNEIGNDTDHTFINQSDVEKYRTDMVAYTERIGYCSFATQQQLMESDFYIINPEGFYELQANTKDLDIRLCTIYITTPFRTLLSRIENRGDFASWQQNYANEEEEFNEFEKSNNIDYRILNGESINESVEKFINIIEKDKTKNA